MENLKINQNKIILIGSLTRDPETKAYGDNKQYTKISIMTNTKGSKTFNNLTIWNEDLIKNIRNLKKDDIVEIVGRLVDKKYTNAEGQKRSRIEILPYEIKKHDSIMANENKVDLMGRLVAKPELQTTGNGKEFTRISLAIANKKSKAKEGPADFFSVTLWEKAAVEAVNLNKAEWVELQGILRNTKYEKNGQSVYVTEILPDLFRKKVWEDRNNISSTNINQQTNNDVYNDVDLGFMSIEPIYDEDMPFM